MTPSLPSPGFVCIYTQAAAAERTSIGDASVSWGQVVILFVDLCFRLLDGLIGCHILGHLWRLGGFPDFLLVPHHSIIRPSFDELLKQFEHSFDDVLSGTFDNVECPIGDLSLAFSTTFPIVSLVVKGTERCFLGN